MERYDILKAMRARLRETGVYQADGSTLIDAELAAYAAGFRLVLDAYEQLQREMLVQTASDYGLVLREQLTGYSFSHLETPQRRQMLLGCLSVGPEDHTTAALERALDSVGITATITEHPAERAITVTVTDVSRLRQQTTYAVQSLAAPWMPAHLLVTYDCSAVISA